MLSGRSNDSSQECDRVGRLAAAGKHSRDENGRKQAPRGPRRHREPPDTRRDERETNRKPCAERQATAGCRAARGSALRRSTFSETLRQQCRSSNGSSTSASPMLTGAAVAYAATTATLAALERRRPPGNANARWRTNTRGRAWPPHRAPGQARLRAPSRSDRRRRAQPANSESAPPTVRARGSVQASPPAAINAKPAARSSRLLCARRRRVRRHCASVAAREREEREGAAGRSDECQREARQPRACFGDDRLHRAILARPEPRAHCGRPHISVPPGAGRHDDGAGELSYHRCDPD